MVFAASLIHAESLFALDRLRRLALVSDGAALARLTVEACQFSNLSSIVASLADRCELAAA